MRYVKYNIRNAKNGPRVTSYELRMNDGSALILTVVLTSLLAMVGVLFVMMARVNQIATSGISESRELDAAIETVIAKISEELVLDVPGVSATNPDYYDYPDANNAWLASLEPYRDGTVYKWRQISDITGYFPDPCVKDVPAVIIGEHDEITKLADADGDGVADSKWIELDDITSSKGKPIYAAIRIVDNGGMINVNTAYKFDPDVGPADANLIDGSSQMQINLAALAERGANGSPATAADKLQAERCGTEPPDLSLYEQNVVWRYGSPSGAYTPFDIGDELKLRNRYIISKTPIDTRISDLWERVFDWKPYVPRNEKYHSITEPNDWFWYVNNSSPDTNSYNYRHIATAYNMDRIIRPDGGRMLNINHDDPNVNVIYNAIRAGLIDGGITDPNSPAAQITVNLIDFRDNDSNVISINVGGSTYYGFERPCIYISELAHRFVEVFPPGGPIGASTVYRSYAIELYKYPGDKEPNGNDWRLVIGEAPGGPIGAPIFGEREYDIDWLGTDFHVIRFQDPLALLVVVDGDAQEPDFERFTEIFEPGDFIELRRRVRADDGSDIWIAVDSVVASPGLPADGNPHSIQRDITLHKCIRRLWSLPLGGQTLGSGNNFQYAESPDVYIPAHPANEDFTNVGEIGMIFRKGAYYYERGERFGRIGYGINKTEDEVRVDLAKPYYQNLFQYVTVLDPYNFYPGDANYVSETRIKGRININTAPWYVIAQLPWISQRKNQPVNYELAQAIVAYRDNTVEGFRSIGELNNVAEMYYYVDGNDQPGFPDLTPVTPFEPGDGAIDDFEERDIIFARISNLVTVRSDVFTAYILVRIGSDGPQKRVIAILDRSDVYSPTNRVKIVAVHPVADPR